MLRTTSLKALWELPVPIVNTPPKNKNLCLFNPLVLASRRTQTNSPNSVAYEFKDLVWFCYQFISNAKYRDQGSAFVGLMRKSIDHSGRNLEYLESFTALLRSLRSITHVCIKLPAPSLSVQSPNHLDLASSHYETQYPCLKVTWVMHNFSEK